MGKVMVLLGSASDRSKMEPAISKLAGKVDVEVHVVSAHRTPEKFRDIVINSDADIFIAGAGMAAALPGSIAALTVKPVIGVPLSGSILNGIDALLATVQMPKGVPVATVAIDGAENAAILALEILGLNNERAMDAVYKEREEMRVYAEKTDREFVDNIRAKIKSLLDQQAIEDH